MRTLRYWVAEHQERTAYSLVAKTKRDLLIQITKHGYREEDIGNEIYQKELIYEDGAFSLFEKVTGEGGGRSCGVTVKTYRLVWPGNEYYVDVAEEVKEAV